MEQCKYKKGDRIAYIKDGPGYYDEGTVTRLELDYYGDWKVWANWKNEDQEMHCREDHLRPLTKLHNVLE